MQFIQTEIRFHKSLFKSSNKFSMPLILKLSSKPLLAK
ncbi:hypothetical protein HPSA50_1620 [Helicobacter pylori SouthAfrica50]|uniref:Uncharacterized protein n=1 Tax=Helicobacter pylori SouthAfrica50 TaxID=1352357 RepID=T2S9B3_HELPX|nr:hypothetical protein HPSA50_1620 [Helicobacter pylori SouthAfrica50]